MNVRVLDHQCPHVGNKELQAGPPPRSETSTGGTPEAEEKTLQEVGRKGKGEREERMEEERYNTERRFISKRSGR